MLQLKLLGHFQLLGDDGSAGDLPGLRDRALVAFLALQGKPQSRERLAGLLWPDRPEAQARQSLRQSLTSLRRIGIPILADGRDFVALGPAIACDAVNFLRYSSREQLDDLRLALAQYDGALLDDWHGQLDAFEEWLVLERSRLAQHMVMVGMRLLAWPTPRLQATERLFISRKILESSPFDEAAHREELTALNDMALRGEAVLSHRNFARRLKAEIGIDPSVETLQLVNSLRNEKRLVIEKNGHSQANRPPVRSDRLCVFALDNCTGQAEVGYICSGIMSEVAASLSRFHSFEVIAPAACTAIADRPNRHADAVRELGADYALEGQLEGNSSSFTISLRLHNLKDATLLWNWSSRYGGHDSLSLFNVVAHSVAESITGRIDHERLKAANRASPSELAAFDIWLRAQHLLLRWDEEVDASAEELLLKAIEIDPRLARAHSSLALQLNARPLLWPGYANEMEDRKRAMRHARLAVDCDPHDPRSHLALMWLSLWECDRRKAARHGQIAYELNPYSADILMHVGLVKANLGETTTGLRLTAEAIDLNPLYPDWYSYMKSMAHVMAGEFDLALATGRSVAEQFLELPGWLAVAATLQGDSAEASRMAELLNRLVRQAWKGDEPCSDQQVIEWFLSVNRWLEGRERDILFNGLAQIVNPDRSTI